MLPFPQMDPDHVPDMSALANGGAARAQPRMLAPGYYSQECNAHKPCDPGGLNRFLFYLLEIRNAVFQRPLGDSHFVYH